MTLARGKLTLAKAVTVTKTELDVQAIHITDHIEVIYTDGIYSKYIELAEGDFSPEQWRGISDAVELVKGKAGERFEEMVTAPKEVEPEDPTKSDPVEPLTGGEK